VILSGDTLLQWIGTAPWVSRAVFVTDVDGVYTRDPKKGDATSSPARLLREIKVTRGTSSGGDLVVTPVDDADRIEVSGSEHEHDVTGGLKVRLVPRCFLCIVNVEE
jgi:isopentenyl phosphate kinase